MKAESETELIDKVLEGDKKIFNKLAKKYYSFWLCKAYKIVKDKDVAKDILQNALLAAYFSMHTLHDKHAFKQWVAGIIHNLCKNYLRDTCKKYSSLKAYYEAFHDATGIAKEEKMIHIILSAINMLDKEYGKIVYAFYYENKSILDICNEFSITQSSVKVRLHRARKELKSILEQHPEFKEYQQYFINKNSMKQVRIIDMILGGVNKESCSLLLYDEEGCQVLPVVIKKEEAEAMLSAMKNIDFPRPMIFHLIKEIIRTHNIIPAGAYITELSGGVFISHLKVNSKKGVKEYDARPSDAITIALMFNCPISVSQKILDTAGFPVPERYKSVSPQEKGIDHVTQLVEQSLVEMKEKIAANKIEKPASAIQAQINQLMKFVFEHV